MVMKIWGCSTIYSIADLWSSVLHVVCLHDFCCSWFTSVLQPQQTQNKVHSRLFNLHGLFSHTILLWLHSNFRSSSCSHSRTLDYRKKIDLSKKKADEAKSEAVVDVEMDFLQKELNEELQREHLLTEELRVITNEIGDLEHHGVSVEERRQLLKKLE